MLESLKIRNFALLEKASLKFSKGLNVITGQTGAGKSILINSLAMVLGERVDRKIVRSGSDSCEVVAVFAGSIPKAAADFLKEKDLCEEDLILRRKFYSRGRSNSYINDRNVPLSTLNHLGDMLVDIHSQHQHQALLKPAVQGELLDRYASAEDEVKKLKELWFQKRDLEVRRASMAEKQYRTDEEITRLLNEKNEIDSVNPEPGLDEEIEKEYRILSNIENIYSVAEEIYEVMYDKEESISEIIASYLQDARSISEVDERLKPVCGQLNSALVAIEEASMNLGSYIESTEFDTTRLEEVMEKRSRLAGLKRKFGPSLEDVVQYRKQLEERLKSYDNYEKQIKELAEEIKKVSEKLENSSAVISRLRKTAAENLTREVTENLSALGMETAKFRVGLNGLSDIGPGGSERAEFYLTPNPGEPEMEFTRIASGGEISRVMLAVKSSLADADETPLLIFDEIDTGIGATLGEKVGEKLKELSDIHQIITVTHLPQIACKADDHVKVHKKSADGRTVTKIVQVKGDERVREIARMLGGKADKSASLRAKEILK